MTFNGGSDGVSLNITGTAHPFTELTRAGTNAVTVSFWEYGDISQPDRQFAFYANGTGGRAISSHAPWSDGVVYFDTAGCCNGNQRLTSRDRCLRATKKVSGISTRSPRCLRQQGHLY